MKARPIAPGTSHPMKALLGLAGRAWSFITSQMTGDHFVINKTQDVPTFLEETQRTMGARGKIGCEILDIEGCFPNMPKDAIRLALRGIAQEMRKQGHDGVWVPKTAKTQPCAWRPRGKFVKIFINSETLCDVAEFALDHAYITMPDGRLMRQTKGIPMGLPISPGMTVGTCGWMEKEWVEGMDDSVRQRFAAKRFMDDILLLYEKSDE